MSPIYSLEPTHQLLLLGIDNQPNSIFPVYRDNMPFRFNYIEADIDCAKRHISWVVVEPQSLLLRNF